MNNALTLCNWFVRMLANAHSDSIIAEQKRQERLALKARLKKAHQIQKVRAKNNHQPKVAATLAEAQRHFDSTGWTYRTAAPLVGCNFGHLHQVLTGQRVSNKVLAKVMTLPTRKVVAK